MKSGILFLIFIVFLKVLVAGSLPVTMDEAYYADWARTLDFGYFDHPPMIALWTWPVTWLAHPQVLTLRLMSLLSVVLCMLLSYSWYRNFRDYVPTHISLLILWGSFAGLLYGILATPDVPLLLFWILALWAAQKALQGLRWYWLIAGFATGLGLLSKYTMALMGLVFLWALIKNPKELRRPWPYLGGCLAFLIFSLNISWNAQHQWVTFNFQFKHGVDAKRNEMVASEIPRAQKAPVASFVFQDTVGFYNSFWDRAKPDNAWNRIKKETPVKQILSLFEYLGGILGLFGLISVVALVGSMQRKQPALRALAAKEPLLAAAAFIPILFFGGFAVLGNSEANWAAMACYGVAPFLGRILLAQSRSGQEAETEPKPSLQRPAKLALFLHLIVLVLVAAHSVWSLLPLPVHKDRLRQETAGFQELAEYLEPLNLPVYADKYQVTAMLNFYAPKLAVKQWPGITRDSDYTLRASRKIRAEEYQQLDRMLLITSDMPAPYLDDFRMDQIEELSACYEQNKVSLMRRHVGDPAGCQNPIRRLFAVEYRKRSP